MIYSSRFKTTRPDELRAASNQLGLIIEYLRSNPTTRVCVQYNSKDEIDVLQSELSKLSIVTANYTVACKGFRVLRELLSRNIPAYVDFPVTDWETFSNLVAMGVTDVLIDGPLAFDLTQLNKRKQETKIRVRPDASVNASLSFEDNENSFFIRPEDIDFYEPYINVLEIFNEDREKEETIFKIYKRKSFSSDLSLLIKHLNCYVPNPYIMPEFAKHRLDCKQACKRSPGRCQMCKNAFDTTTLVATKLMQDKQK